MTKGTVLIIEDNPDFQKIYGDRLVVDGYNVLQASDGEAGLIVMRSHVVNLVITDLNMPTLDGIGLIRKVRVHPSYKFIPIIMLTTESQDTRKLEGKQAGATGWIIKPFKPEQLVSVVKKVLG